MGSIRTLLAISVLITHSDPLFGIRLLSGDMAITSFYICSGFLMALILSGKYTSTRSFYLNRILRIYPPYWTAVLLSVAIFAVTHHSSFDPFYTLDRAIRQESWLWIIWSAISNVTLIGIDLTRYIAIDEETLSMRFPNFLTGGGGDGHKLLLVPQAWTLAIELGFYLLAPLFARLPTLWLFALTVAWTCARIVAFDAVNKVYPFDDSALLLFQLPYFLMGMVGYRWFRWFEAVKVPMGVKRGIAIGGVALAVAMIFGGYAVLHPRPRHDFDIFYAVFALTVPLQFFLTRHWKLDKFLGEFSYPIYVFHYGLGMYLTRWPLGDVQGEVLLLVTALLSLGYIVLIDNPIQRIRASVVARQGARAPDTEPAAVTAPGLLVATQNTLRAEPLPRQAIARLRFGLGAFVILLGLGIILHSPVGPLAPSSGSSPSDPFSAVPSTKRADVLPSSVAASCIEGAPRVGPLLVSDSFKREAPTELGLTDTKQEWKPMLGRLGIQQGLAMGLEPDHNLSVVDGGSPNVVMEVEFSGDTIAAVGLALRISSLNDYLRLFIDNRRELVLMRGSTSGNAIIGRTAIQAWNQTRLRVDLVGDCLTIIYNDQPAIQVKESFNASATQYGLWLPRGRVGVNQLRIWSAT